jgi:uncharacterized membrane protein YheB (UPF0754 family)
MHYEWVLVPLITAFTGWFVGRLLVRMLFYPGKLQQLPWFTGQGSFPNKQQTIAGKLGKLVSEELFSFASLEEKISGPENFEKLMPLIETHVDAFLRVKLPAQMPMIGMLVGERTINEMKTVFIAELKELFPVIMKNYMSGLQTEMDPARLIAEKIAGLSDDKLNGLIKELIGNAGKKAALIGALIGFSMGLVQVFILIYA